MKPCTLPSTRSGSRVYGLTVTELLGSLQAANVVLQAGATVSEGRSVPVQAAGSLQTATRSPASWCRCTRAVRSTCRTCGGSRRTRPAGTVCDVRRGTGRAQKGVDLAGTAPAVTIAVSKKPGENAIDVTRAVLERVELLRGTYIPDGIEVTVTRDYGVTANDKAQKLIQKLAFATISVVLLVWLTVGWREAVVVGAAVVITLAATLFASWAWGFTINRVSLFALIFAIGILVDDAIVVVENINRHMSLHPGAGLGELIPRAVDEVGGPRSLRPSP